MTALRTQSRLASFIEAVSNTVIGFFISVTAQWMLFHLYGIKATVTQFVWLSIWMTVLSVVRSYVLRRMWNAEWWTKFKRDHADRGTVLPVIPGRILEFNVETQKHQYSQPEIPDLSDPATLQREIAKLTPHERRRLDEKLIARGLLPPR